MRVITALLLTGVMSFVFGQNKVYNYIKNPCLEDLRDIPEDTDQFYLVNDWYNASGGSPDVFHDKGVDKGKIPGLGAGKHHAAEKKVCIGLINYKKTTQKGGKDGFREYVGTKLKKPLLSGRKYKIRFKYAVNTEAALYSPDLGIEFTKKPLMGGYSIGRIEGVEPDVEMTYNAFLRKRKRELWYSFSQTYIAKGGEQFMTIGNFKKNKDSYTEELKVQDYLVTNNYSYFLMDSFALELVPEGEPLLAAYYNKQNCMHFDVDAEDFKKDTSITYFNNFLKMVHDVIGENTLLIKAATDTTGAKSYNESLGVKRAKNMMNYLLNYGFKPEQLKVAILPEHGVGREARFVSVVISSK